MHIISKKFNFSASHQLVHLPHTHPCSRLHGHNYEVIVEIKGAVDPKTGFVVDYRDLKPIGDWIDEHLDHRHLNDIFPFPTTVENMSKSLYECFQTMVPKLHAVILSETPKTSCRYEK